MRRQYDNENNNNDKDDNNSQQQQQHGCKCAHCFGKNTVARTTKPMKTKST